MSTDDPKLVLKNAILEWRKKYGVQDNDPMLAAVELWEIYFSHAQVNGSKERLPSFEEFRNTMEQCERLSGDLTGRAAEIIEELRAVPKIRSDLNRFPMFALVFTAALALLAGILIGEIRAVMGTRHIATITAALSITAALCFVLFVSAPVSWIAAGLFAAFGVFAATTISSTKRKPIVRLKGMVWARDDFCRGWLITGDTGSGKTRSGITPLLYQVFQNEPNWGGVCIDDKGIYWETLSEMARHFNRQNDLVLLQVRPDNPPLDWQPTHTYNLTSNPAIPHSTYAKFVVDTATSLGQQGDKSFFKSQAQTHIAHALEALYEIQADVTLENAHELLLNEDELDDAIEELADSYPTERRRALVEHFRHRYLNQPPEQMGGVKETIANYLHNFLTPDIAQVFCPSKNTFDFADIDRGKIICIAMPQKYQTERRYVNTFLKMLFYTHVLRRFDRPKAVRQQNNLLILWADEAQRFMTANEDGMSDYNSIDVIREANATVVAAAQSSTSFLPALGKEKAKVLVLNLRNRIIFKAADEEGAQESADFLGKKRVVKKTWGVSAGQANRSYVEHEEHKVKPHILRALPKHTAVLVHCERGFKRAVLPPIEPNGQVSPWFRRRLF